jgi:hypothetical protein
MAEDETRLVQRWSPFTGQTVADLADWCHERDLSPDEVTVTGGQLKWVSPETGQELARRLAYEADKQARTDSWELATYERLKLKFGG